jgi:pyrroline-5-carboxylate reductase
MLHGERIAFIGSGAMAEAIISGVLGKEIAAAEQITASDVMQSRLEYMADTYGVHVTTDNARAVQDATIVVLSVKPQVYELVAPGLRGEIPAQALVLSIMAGITLDALGTGLQHERLVRAMPNTPAQVNMATDAVSEAQRAAAQALLRALGEDLPVSNEAYIDMQTGLGGSGPGFVFLIIEALIDAGVQMGFSRADAQKIVLQTVAGSVELVRSSGKHPAELRNLVTSPGGTTAAGLYELERAGVRTALADAVLAAYRRSQELGA